MRCHICGRYGNIEMHHVFGGQRRKISDKYGAVVPLCHNCHNEPPNGVHHNKEVRLALQAEMQQQLMDRYGWTAAEFIKVFGKNYL